MIASIAFPSPGPSPRGWGNLYFFGVGFAHVRAIPTWVGKSGNDAITKPRTAGHPHVGGEIAGIWSPLANSDGPSPRGWGNHKSVHPIGHYFRAIPTWVGKSHLAQPLPEPLPGHPHVGGEIGMNTQNNNSPAGPSPRGWGNPNRPSPRQNRSWAIPTWVGKSEHVGNRFDELAGHPHVGGEIARKASEGERASGPSPRGWGNPGRSGRATDRRRAIPTWVGKSAPAHGPARLTTGHPHVGGEIRHFVSRQCWRSFSY